MSDPTPGAVSRRVLVVSDDPAIVEEARAGFPVGFAVDSAPDAREALMVIERGSAPDLLIVDLQTGSAGGFALARDLSMIARFASVPILMVLERDQDVWLARQAGAVATKTKPIDFDQLVASALSLLS